MKDAAGKEIKEGDLILYAALNGRSAVLHRGKVLGFKPTKVYWQEKPLNKIKVEIDSWDKKSKKIVYLQYPDAVVVI